MLPTPTAKANMLSPSMQKWPAHRNLFPTPAAQSYGSNQGGAAGRTGKVRPSLETMARQGMETSGPLNPEFVSWLMGYPPAWLNCAPSAMRSSQPVRRRS